MKKLILSLLILASALILEAGKPEPKVTNAREAIQSAIRYPKFAIEEGIEGSVSLILQVRSDGHVEIIRAHSCCQKLLQYTVSKVQELVLSPELINNGEPFSLRINYELL